MTWEGSTRRDRLPSNWKAIRLAVLERDGHRCQIRDDGCEVVAVEVDHIEAGKDDHRMEALQAACTWCHGRKSSREGAAARGPRVSTRRRPEKHPGLR